MSLSRRAVLAGALAMPAVARAHGTSVVVVGGGFGGASAARVLARAGIAVTLVEPNATYVACPFSNAVIGGLRDMDAQRFGYGALAREGIRIIAQAASGVAPGRVTLADGAAIEADRIILAPGIDLIWNGLPGYTEAAAEQMPHAWKAGEQTLLLRARLEAMPEGGLVVMAIPANPYRCPPGPYERASLIAHYLKLRKPRAKLILLDAKDAFSKQRLFQNAWKALYPNLEWRGLGAGGKVIEVVPQSGIVRTEFESFVPDLANIIPPQRAAAIAAAAGVADRTGWCPIDPVSFESRLVPGIHVIGDAAIAGAMPKSAFAANAQAKACARAVLDLLAHGAPAEPRLLNTCYSLVGPGYGISVAGVYRPANGVLADVEGAGGSSPIEAPADFRAQEAANAEAWIATITAEAFG